MPDEPERGGTNTREWHVQKSATQETDWHRASEERFAEGLAQRLKDWTAKERFRHLIIAADPRTLGSLRTAYGNTLESVLVAEINKDTTNMPIDRMEDVPRDA